MSEDTEGSVFTINYDIVNLKIYALLIVGIMVTWQCLHLSKNDMCFNAEYQTPGLEICPKNYHNDQYNPITRH